MVYLQVQYRSLVKHFLHHWLQKTLEVAHRPVIQFLVLIKELHLGVRHWKSSHLRAVLGVDLDFNARMGSTLYQILQRCRLGAGVGLMLVRTRFDV